ncbi:Ku protein, partial [Bradyrhizobium valentinum]|uniref:Ku protein n=1 Tax=Bradyrhizobium valentinum TaxID=1518501 RepID=UPI0030B80593
MPASRPYWKGYLKLSFVSCPVALYPAISAAERISFRQVNRRTGHRLKQKLIDSVTGQAIDAADKARGYEVGENEFLLVEDRDLERARRERLVRWSLPPRPSVKAPQPFPPAFTTRPPKRAPPTLMRKT